MIYFIWIRIDDKLGFIVTKGKKDVISNGISFDDFIKFEYKDIIVQYKADAEKINKKNYDVDYWYNGFPKEYMVRI